MDIENCYKVGFILKPHGLKGAVTVALDPVFLEAVDAVDALFVQVSGDMVPYFVDSISTNGRKAYVKFEDVDSIEAAETITKKPVFLPREFRARAGRGEFYDDEVIGFEVVDENHGALGKVTEVVNAGPNRLLTLFHDGKEVLIPVNSPFIKSLNKGRKTFTVDLPEGFLDI